MYYELSYKMDELTDHLGSVRTVVKDVKYAAPSPQGSVTAPYRLSVDQVNDYYPFGMEMSGRYSTTAPEDLSIVYRYGFNGMEKVDELKGSGNHYTAPFWEYDPRVVRRWNIDSVVKHWESPYAVFHNNPIYFTDPQGDDPPEKTKTHKIEKGQTLSGIAKQHGTTVDNLVAWNDNISDPDKIYAGSEINVSDPSRWVGVSNGVWSDTENPDERWAKQDGEWVDLNAQTLGEWFDETYSQPVGHISSDGEMTIGKYHSGADAMMPITPLMIAWGAMVYANPRLPKVGSSGSSGYQYLGKWQKGGNFGHFGSYKGQGFNFNTSHGFYRPHATSGLANGKLTANQVERAIARNAYNNLNKIPQVGGRVTPYQGTVNVGGTNVGYRAVMNREPSMLLPIFQNSKV